jgi:spore coat protein CotH
VDLTLPAASRDALFADPYTYVEASVTFDGELMDPVGVRLRGKIGSFRDLNGKPKFKVDFNQYVPTQRFHGLETIALNNSIVDCSFLKEVMAYALFEAAGVAASRTGFAQVTVNGASYGLYVLTEVPDDRFLKRAWAEPDGNLYDGKYVWYGGYDYTLLDFGIGVDDLFQLEEGADVGHADVHAVSDAVIAHRGELTWYEGMAEVLDWGVFHRMWAVEQWVGQNDGYSLNTNNYRVYFDPATGLANFIPWDLDYSFLYDWEWGMNWAYPRGQITAYCLANPSCAEAQRAVVSEVLDVAEALEMVSLFDEMATLLYTAAAADPRRECSMDSLAYEQAEVRAWLGAQNNEMRAWWGL